MNAIVRGWANYYRHTSLVQDIEEITRYTWHRYLYWLLKKHQGSRKQQLINAKCKVIHGRTRWTAQISEGETTLFAYQWLATRRELKRSKYLQKGRNGFVHPYRTADNNDVLADYPTGEKEPEQSIYTLRIGVPSQNPKRKEPLEMAEWKLRAKMRDKFQCVRCGNKENLHLHHKKGMKSHRIEHLETLCSACHWQEHGYRQRKPR